MEQKELESKVMSLEKHRKEDDTRWFEVIRKLDEIINSRKHEDKAAEEFRIETKSDIKLMKGEVATLKLNAALSGQSLKQFELVRDTIVKKVAGLVFIALLSVGTMTAVVVAYMSK